MLVEAGSRELGKASLKTTPCLRPDEGAPVLDIKVPARDRGVAVALAGDVKELTLRLVEAADTMRA